MYGIFPDEEQKPTPKATGPGAPKTTADAIEEVRAAWNEIVQAIFTETMRTTKQLLDFIMRFYPRR